MSFWQGKRVSVTGGAGMIGSHLVELLVQAGARVTIADNFSRGRRANIEHIQPRPGIWDLDLRHIENCCLAMQDSDVVFNMVARVTGIEYNRHHHGEMFHNNLLLQILPLQAALEIGVPRFVQISTACIYPSDAPIPTPEEAGGIGKLPEPTNLGYGLAKLMGEWAVQQAVKEHGLQASIVRFFNAYGPRDYFDWETAHVIPALIRKTLEHERVVVWGSGRQCRSFLYARDAALGAMAVAERVTDGSPVNVGVDELISMLILAHIIQALLEVTRPIDLDFTKPDGYRQRLPDLSRLRALTLWTPTSLVEGLQQTIAWYLKQRSIVGP